MLSSRSIAGIPLSLWAVGILGVGTGAVFAASAKLSTPTALASLPERAPRGHRGVDASAPELAGAREALAGQGTAVRPTHPERSTIQFRDSAPHAERPTAPASDSRNLGRSFTLFALLLAAGGAFYLVRRKQSGGRLAGTRRKDLQVRSTVRLGGRWQIALIDVPGATLVVGSSDKGLTLLTRLDGEPDLGEPSDAGRDAVATLEARTLADRSPSSQNRQDFLQQLLGQMRGGEVPAPERSPEPATEEAPLAEGPASAARPLRPEFLPAEARALRQKLARYGHHQERAAS